MVTKRGNLKKGGIILALFLLVGIGFVFATGGQSSSLEKLDVNTCSGSGDLFLYNEIFTDINTSFTADEDQIIIFTRGELTEFTVRDDGVEVSKDLVFSSTSPFHVKVYSVEVTPGSLVSIEAGKCFRAGKEWDSRCVKGYLIQDSENPAYDLDSLEIIYDGEKTNEMNLLSGTYNYVFFDKYSLFNPGSGDDNRELSVLINGSSETIVDKTYTSPNPSSTEGAVFDEFEITENGNYTLSVDTDDSIYWPLMKCETPDSSVRELDVNTCTGNGSLYLYEGDNPFQQIDTSFTTSHNQLLIFAKPQANLEVKLNGSSVSLDEIFSQDSPLKVRVYLVNTTPGDLVEITGSTTNSWNARGVQGYITQNKENPVYDIDSLTLLYQSQNSMEWFLTPGEYSYVFFDKYTINLPGGGTDFRELDFLVENSSSTILDETFNHPQPTGTQGAVTGNFEIEKSGNYTLSVDSQDSVYYPFVQCEKPEEPFCGDGIINQEFEECDDGNMDDGDGCSSECLIEEEPMCGDGNLDSGEECDDGNLIDGDGCSAQCDFEKGCIDVVKEAFDTNLEKITPVPQFEFSLNDGEQVAFSNSLGLAKFENVGLGINNVSENLPLGWQLISVTPQNGKVVVSPGEECSTVLFKNKQIIEEPFCGDGNLDSGEECDDGNQNNTDSCRNDCTVPVCGDNIVDFNLGETCDEGIDNGNICTPDYGGICSYCTDTCELKEKEIFCGDGVLQEEFEQCDDGNNIDGDGCSNTCETEEDEPLCGNGILEEGEQCDDGNLDNGDGCSAQCDVEEICVYNVSVRYSYSNSYDTGIGVRPVSGDWISDKPAELIKGENYEVRYYVDNNELLSNDAHLIAKLDDSIISEYDYTIGAYHSKTLGLDISDLECDTTHKISIEVESEDNQICEPDDISDNFAEREIYIDCLDEEPICGDGKINQAFEQCDDGNMDDGDGCSSECLIEEEPMCGDGNLDSGEECDDGNLIDGDGCSSSCEIEEDEKICGDGVINQEFEECDDGNSNNLDSCRNDCSLPFCGDGIKDSGEMCDDGNNDNGDGCSAICEEEEDEPICGNGIVETGEECDLGNDNGQICVPSYGNSCSYCSSTCEEKELEGPFCGDGTLNLQHEQCDDGNNVNGDGCSSSCQEEKTSCVGPSCGITPNITTENFPPKVWMCDSRVVYDDGTEPGRISEDGQDLVERINNYAFEGEQVSWRVLVMDKNGLEKIRDVYATLDNNIEANCQFEGKAFQVEDSCNARILEEELTGEDLHEVAGYYTCTFTVETPDSMYGESKLSVEAEDLDGIISEIDEKEYWFFNPEVSLGIQGGIEFDETRPGTSSYSDSVLITNNADFGSGVLMDMFVSGTDFYDSASSGAKCPTSNTLELENFKYFATNGAYSTQDDGRSDSEGYNPIEYGVGFNDPSPFYDRNEIIQSSAKEGPYYLGNILSPGSDLALTFRLDLPEPCNGDFDSGSIYFWGEAV